jgi:hypothetical protein
MLASQNVAKCCGRSVTTGGISTSATESGALKSQVTAAVNVASLLRVDENTRTRISRPWGTGPGGSITIISTDPDGWHRLTLHFEDGHHTVTLSPDGATLFDT